MVTWRQHAVKSSTSYTQMMVGDLDPERVSAAHSAAPGARLRLPRASEGPAEETVHRMHRTSEPRGALQPRVHRPV